MQETGTSTRAHQNSHIYPMRPSSSGGWAHGKARPQSSMQQNQYASNGYEGFGEAPETWGLFTSNDAQDGTHPHDHHQALMWTDPQLNQYSDKRLHFGYQDHDHHRDGRPHSTGGTRAFSRGAAARRPVPRPFTCYAARCGNPDHQSQYPRPESRGLVADVERLALVRAPVGPPASTQRGAGPPLGPGGGPAATAGDRLTPAEKYALGKQRKGDRRGSYNGAPRYYGAMTFDVPTAEVPLRTKRPADIRRLSALYAQSREAAIVKGARTRADVSNGFRALKRGQPTLQATLFRAPRDPPAGVGGAALALVGGGAAARRARGGLSSALSDARMGTQASPGEGFYMDNSNPPSLGGTATGLPGGASLGAAGAMAAVQEGWGRRADGGTPRTPPPRRARGGGGGGGGGGPSEKKGAGKKPGGGAAAPAAPAAWGSPAAARGGGGGGGGGAAAGPAAAAAALPTSQIGLVGRQSAAQPRDADGSQKTTMHTAIPLTRSLKQQLQNKVN